MMNNKPQIINFNTFGSSDLGYISVAEQLQNVPFKIKRVYWTYYTPNDIERGNHAHKKLEQIIVAVSGSITFVLEDNIHNRTEYILNTPSIGLYIPKMYWRKIKFSHNAVLLCLASELFNENDYIREYNEFFKK